MRSFVRFTEHDDFLNTTDHYYFLYSANQEDLASLAKDLLIINSNEKSSKRFEIDLKEKIPEIVVDYLVRHSDSKDQTGQFHKKINGELEWNKKIGKMAHKETSLALIKFKDMWKRYYDPTEHEPPKEYLKIRIDEIKHDNGCYKEEFSEIFIQLNGNEEEITRFFIDHKLLNKEMFIFHTPFEINLFKKYSVPPPKSTILDGRFLYTKACNETRYDPKFIGKCISSGKLLDMVVMYKDF